MIVNELKKRKKTWESFLEKLGYQVGVSSTPNKKTATPPEDREAANTSRGKRKREENIGEEETHVISQNSPEQTPALTRKKGKKLLFTPEEKNVQENENLDFVSHKEENPKAKKEKLKEKGKALINISKNGHDKLQIESLKMKNEEYKLLNDNLTEEI